MEQLLFTTARIVSKDSDGLGYGTGFFYKSADSHGAEDIFLVTNKHVIEDATSVSLHLINATSEGGPHLGAEQVIEVAQGAEEFTGHPDLDVDVAAMRVGRLLGGLAQLRRPLFWRHVDDGFGATPDTLDEFEPIEPVTFIGYPDGLYDTSSLLPIVRRGHSATPLSVDYEDKPIFLIDASVFPGSSGSPVFLVVPASTPDKRGNLTIGGGPRCVFLGVVAAVYQRQVPVLTRGGRQPFVEDSLDIGIVYKAAAVEELVKQM